MNDEPIRVVVVSSNQLMRIGLRRIIDNHPKLSIVAELDGGSTAVEVISREGPKVILIDYDLLGVDVLDLIRNVHRVVDPPLTLILGNIEDEDLTRQALNMGAAGIVLKIQPPSVLISTIESLCRCESHVDREVTQPVLPETNKKLSMSKNDHATRKLTTLTVREREIIGLVGKGLRNREIAVQLGISDITVRHHLTTTFEKLEVSDRQNLMVFAHLHGLIDLAESPDSTYREA